MHLRDYYLNAIFAVFIATFFYFYYTKIRKLETFFKKIPSPPTKPILGNARDFKSTSDLFKTLHKYTKEFGSMVHVKMGPVGHILLCSDYDFIQFMLNNTKSFSKSRNLKFLKPWIGYGLATIEGDLWKRHRKLITPAFHFKILEKFVDIFESGTDTLVENLSKIGEQTSFDIYPYITRCTLEIICETAMGTKIDVQTNETSLYFQSVKDMCRIFMVRTISILKRYDLFFLFTKDYLIQRKALKYLHDQTNLVIKRKLQELKQNTENRTKTKKVFIDLILETNLDGQILSQNEIRDEINTFMFAGHDTTATASSLVLYCLANNRNVQEKVFKEQQHIFGNVKNAKASYATLHDMKYLELVIKESMRLYTPVPIFGRETKEDVQYNDMFIPKGVNIIIFTHGLHMNPKYYPEPEKFDPTRFEAMDGKQPYAYIPFSAGPRNCIGQKYAMLEIKSLVAKIIRNFELSPAVPHHVMDLAAETVLKSLNGVKIGLKLRQGL